MRCIILGWQLNLCVGCLIERCYFQSPTFVSSAVNCKLCACVYKRLRARVAEWGAMLLADDEGSITHQVHAVSSVEDSIFMESSHGPLFLEAR